MIKPHELNFKACPWQGLCNLILQNLTCYDKNQSHVQHTNKKNVVSNAEIPLVAYRSVYGANSKYIGTECTPTNSRLKKHKKTLQPCNQPGEVSNNKYKCSSKKWSQCETVALWNSLVTWKLAQYLSDVTGSPTVNGGLSLVAVLLITNIHGSVAFPVLLPIDIENLHHYLNVVYR